MADLHHRMPTARKRDEIALGLLQNRQRHHCWTAENLKRSRCCCRHLELPGYRPPTTGYQLDDVRQQPVLSLGSNHVDFGGMIPPASEMIHQVAHADGYIEKATAARRRDHGFELRRSARAPPTNSTRFLNAGPDAEPWGENVSCRRVTRDPRRVRAHSAARQARSYAIARRRTIATSPRRAGPLGRRSVESRVQRRQQPVCGATARSLRRPGCREHLHLGIGNAKPPECVPLPDAPVVARNVLPRAGGAGSTMMPVRDVHRWNLFEARCNQIASSGDFDSTRHTVCCTSSTAVKSKIGGRAASARSVTRSTTDDAR